MEELSEICLSQKAIAGLRLIEKLIVKYGKFCKYCTIETILLEFGERSRHNAATIDHVVPKSKGGSNKQENLAVACYACNRHKGNMSEEEYRETRYFKQRIHHILNHPKSFQ